MRNELQRWLTQTAYYATESSVSSAGDITHGAPASFLCRIEQVRWMHGPNFLPRHGEAVESLTLLFTETAVPLNALVWLPGEDETDSEAAHHVTKRDIIWTREGTVSHYEIWID